MCIAMWLLTESMTHMCGDRDLPEKEKTLITSKGTETEVIDEIVSTITRILDSEVAGIGIGVPSVLF